MCLLGTGRLSPFTQVILFIWVQLKTYIFNSQSVHLWNLWWNLNEEIFKHSQSRLWKTWLAHPPKSFLHCHMKMNNGIWASGCVCVCACVCAWRVHVRVRVRACVSLNSMASIGWGCTSLSHQFCFTFSVFSCLKCKPTLRSKSSWARHFRF